MAPIAYSGPYGPLNPDPNAPVNFLDPQGAAGAPQAPNPYAHLGTLTDPVAPVAAPEAPKASVGPATEAAREAIGKRSKVQQFQDSPYLSQALLAASRGLFDGDLGAAISGFGSGVSAFNQAQMRPDVAGGPDDAFLIHTDANGQQTFMPNEAVQGYLKDKREADARVRLTPKSPEPKDVADMVGRAASFVQKGGDPTEARAFLVSNGVPEAAIPQTLSPAYTAFGATVPQAQAQEVRQAAQEYREKAGDRQFDETVKQHGIANGYKEQANARANAASARAAKKASSPAAGKISATRSIGGKAYYKIGGSWYDNPQGK